MQASEKKRKLQNLYLSELENLKNEAKISKNSGLQFPSGKIRCTYSKDFKQRAITLCNIHGLSIVSNSTGISDSLLSVGAEMDQKEKVDLVVSQHFPS